MEQNSVQVPCGVRTPSLPWQDSSWRQVPCSWVAFNVCSCPKAGQMSTGLQVQVLTFRQTTSFQATQWPFWFRGIALLGVIVYICLHFNPRHLVNYTGKHFTKKNTGTLRNSSCYSAVFIIHMPSPFPVWSTWLYNKAESKDAISWQLATLDIKV